MNIQDIIPSRLKTSKQRLARSASYFALGGLLLFALSLVHPKPLTVIFSMSVGHILGAFAVLLYLIAIIIDANETSNPKEQARASSASSVQADGNSSDPKG